MDPFHFGTHGLAKAHHSTRVGLTPERLGQKIDDNSHYDGGIEIWRPTHPSNPTYIPDDPVGRWISS